MDQLPYLAIKRLFRCLSLRDLLSCRAVNRQLKFYVDQIGVDELIACQGFQCNLSLCANWWPGDRPINYESAVNWKVFLSAASKSPFRLDQQLKFLHIHPMCSNFDFNFLNAFHCLTHLEIKPISQNNSRPVTLTLAYLKVLDVYPTHKGLRDDVSYILKTPKLEFLACPKISRIQTEYPERIKRLKCDYPGENEIMKLTNLQILDLHKDGQRMHLTGPFAQLRDLKALLPPAQLSNLKALRELNLDIENHQKPGVEIEKWLTDLMHARNVPKSELKLYLNDLLFDLDQLTEMGLDYEYFWFKNYKLLRGKSSYSVSEIHYSRLMKLGAELSDDFFDRFHAIKRLIVNGPVDRREFEWFLGKATALTSLQLLASSLDQTFLDCLPELSGELSHLEIEREASGLITNLNFILQLKQLVVLKTDQLLFWQQQQLNSLELPANAFRQLKKFRQFYFKTSDGIVKIDRFAPIKNNYTLEFNTWGFRTRGDERLQSFSQKQLKWEELETLYKQRIAIFYILPPVDLFRPTPTEHHRVASTAQEPIAKCFRLE